MCQNASNEVLLAWFKFQAKTQSPSGVYTQAEKQNTPSLPSALRDIGHSMSIGNLILDAKSVTVSYLIHYDGLL